MPGAFDRRVTPRGGMPGGRYVAVIVKRSTKSEAPSTIAVATAQRQMHRLDGREFRG
jgi:hypothetical protein